VTSSPPTPPDVTVITATYSMERWPLIVRAVASVLAQTVPPKAIILTVDHNPTLFLRLRDEFERRGDDTGPSITVVESAYDGHLGAAATTGVELATTEFVVFLDDDAAAEPTWLERMLAPFADPSVAAVGGAPLPSYAAPRPRWFPHEFDWVFGCAYAGLPNRQAPILHMIGTTMAVRRADVLAIGGIHSNDHGDMELSHRLLAQAPGRKLLYEPDAVVRHHVPAVRLTWAYFWRRCFFVNRSKVAAMRSMGEAAHLRAERSFAARALTRGMLRNLGAMLRGDLGGLQRALAIVVGVTLAGTGYAVGSVEWFLGRRPNAKAMGWVGPLRSQSAPINPMGHPPVA
jgi:glucosyl-dolichyl phosphate glucuronosyltransferase